MIVFAVLKVIGWVIAAVVLLTAALSFAPLRYELSVDNGSARFKSSWLLGLLRIQYRDKKLILKLFWFYTPKERGSAGKRRKTDKIPKKERKKGGITLEQLREIPGKKQILSHIAQFIKRVFKAIKPRVFRIAAHIGFENPAQTGLALAFTGIISGITGLHMDIRGNFEHSVFTYHIYAKDAVIPLFVMIPLISLLLKKPVQALVKQALFGKENESERERKTKPDTGHLPGVA